MPAKISRTDFPRTLIGRRHGGWKDDGHGNRVKFFLFEGTSTNHISSQMSRMHLQSQLTLFLCRKWPLFTLLWHLQGGFRFFWISRPSKAELTVPLVPPMQWWSAPRWVQPAATWAAKPMIAEKKTAQASGVGKWEMWWWWLWWCMGCFFFFPSWSWSHFWDGMWDRCGFLFEKSFLTGVTTTWYLYFQQDEPLFGKNGSLGAPSWLRKFKLHQVTMMKFWKVIL